MVVKGALRSRAKATETVVPRRATVVQRVAMTPGARVAEEVVMVQTVEGVAEDVVMAQTVEEVMVRATRVKEGDSLGGGTGDAGR